MSFYLSESSKTLCRTEIGSAIANVNNANAAEKLAAKLPKELMVDAKTWLNIRDKIRDSIPKFRAAVENRDKARESYAKDYDIPTEREAVLRKNLKEAESELEQALDSVPTYAEATLELAAIRRTAGKGDDALQLLIALLERDPYHFEALLALGETLLSLTRKGDALTAFRRVLAFDPNHAGALYYDGVLLNEQKRFREAIERWRRVIDLEPAGEFARRARREARTAADLHAIFASQAG